MIINIIITLQDHQGNNHRVVINQTGEIEETNHYYPFEEFLEVRIVFNLISIMERSWILKRSELV